MACSGAASSLSLAHPRICRWCGWEIGVKRFGTNGLNGLGTSATLVVTGALLVSNKKLLGTSATLVVTGALLVSNKKLLGTSATLVVTGALLVVTKSY